MNPTEVDNSTGAQPPGSSADVSRANGSKSRGPTTPEGKARSSMNATKDGLFAKTVILPSENRDEFQALLDAHVARHQPEGEDELHLVYTMALCQWQERRIWKAETVKLQERLESNEEYDRKWDKKDAERRFGDAFNDALTKLNTLGRMSSRLARDYQRALRTLAEIRKCKNEPSTGANPKETNEQPKLPSPPLATSHSSLATDSHSSLATPVADTRASRVAPARPGGSLAEQSGNLRSFSNRAALRSSPVLAMAKR